MKQFRININRLISSILQSTPIFIWGVMLLPSEALADVLFHDNFTNELFTRTEWVIPCQTDSTFAFSDQGMTLTNTHGYNSMIAFHSLSNKPSDFSISVTIVKGSPGSGVFFNVNRNNVGTYDGYAAVISYGKAELIKFSKGSIITIASNSSPFIKVSGNTLAVSKKGANISLFCNGYFLYTSQDNEIPAGDCAVMIQPMSHATFSTFEISTQCRDSLQFPPFLDNFDTSSNFGWKKTGNGMIAVDSSHLKIATSTLQQCSYGLEFPLKNFTMKTAITWDTGSDTSLYGIYLTLVSSQKSTQPKPIRFGINRKGAIILQTASDSIIVSSHRENGLLKVSANIQWDTLEVQQKNGSLYWYLNGSCIGEIPSITEIMGAGVFCFQKLNINYDNFILKSNAIETVIPEVNTIKQKNNICLATFSPEKNSSFDILGRLQTSKIGNITKCSGSMVILANGKKIITTK